MVLSTRRIGVLVLSMHRSGSSAITRMFSLLGCALPNSPMLPAFDNPEGHWESQRIADFNDEILSVANTHWGDWLPVDPGLSDSVVWSELVNRGREVLRDEFGDEPLFVLKDPRVCKLAGFWQEVLAAEGIDPAIVIPLRNPIEVARSLAARNGIDEYQCLLIWLRHVLEAEAMTRGKARVFTEYSALLENWELVATRVASSLDIEWPCASPLSAGQISQYLNLDLRHHVGKPAALAENPAISPWISKAYLILAGWAQTDENAADYPILDELMKAFNDAGIAFSQPMMKGAQAAQDADKLRVELDLVVEQRAEIESRLAIASTEHAAISVQNGVLSDELETATTHMHQFMDRMLLAERCVRQGEEQIAGAAAKLVRAREHISALETELQLSKSASDQQAQQLLQKLTVATAKSRWLQSVTAVRNHRPRWWTIMPRKWVRERDHQRLVQRGLFDATAYLARNPDVAASSMDPVLHYMLHGIDEDRN